MITKSLDEHFKSKLEEFEKLKRQKELLEKFPGKILIETLTDEGPLGIDSRSFKREEFVSKDYSLAEKIQIVDGCGYYTPRGIEDSNNNYFSIFNLYFELKDDNSGLCLPVYCREEKAGLEEGINEIYTMNTYYSGHYDEFETAMRFHPRPLDEIIDFYKNQGVKKELLFDLYTQIHDIRKEKPAGRVAGRVFEGRR
jgi:hypothetical protein